MRHQHLVPLNDPRFRRLQGEFHLVAEEIWGVIPTSPGGSYTFKEDTVHLKTSEKPHDFKFISFII